MNSALISSIFRVIFPIIAGGAIALSGAEPKTTQGVAKPLWDEDDEKIFVLLMANEPRLLKGYIDILASSKLVEKRLLALYALAYDRAFYDAPDIFGEDFRVNHVVRLIADQDPEVRKLATAVVLNSLVPDEVVIVIPRLRQLTIKAEQDAELKKELTSTIEQISKKDQKNQGK